MRVPIISLMLLVILAGCRNAPSPEARAAKQTPDEGSQLSQSNSDEDELYEKLKGIWRLRQVLSGGEIMELNPTVEGYIEIVDKNTYKTWNETTGGEKKYLVIGNYQYVLSQSPYWLDFDYNGGNGKAVWRVQNGELHICIGDQRPDDFSANSPERNLLVYMRDK